MLSDLQPGDTVHIVESTVDLLEIVEKIKAKHQEHL
jgi:hypothetical protein